jgi:hypothetical protein
MGGMGMADDIGVVVPESQCPECGHRFDRASDSEFSGLTPAPSDIILCIKCGAILQYDDAMHPQVFTALETLEPDHLSEVLRVRRVLVRMHKVRDR